jgi:hypothetical protein
MKKGLKYLVAGVLAAGVMGATVSAAGEMFQGFAVVNVVVDGKPVVSDVPAINFYGRTLLPVRKIAEIAGFDVSFDAATNTAILTRQGPITAEKAEVAALRAELEGYLKANKPGAAMPLTTTTSDGLVFNVHGLQVTKSVDQFTNAAAGNNLVVADVSLYNGTQEPVSINPLYFIGVDTDARRYTAQISAANDQIKVMTLGAGDRVRGTLVFEIPEKVSLDQVRFGRDPFHQVDVVVKLK